MLGYAVIDCETTGLNRLGNDRIAELAIATFDTDFKLTGQYETLLNPDRDLGLTSLHGINGLMASEAPRFEDVMDSLGHLLHDRIIIGHNVSFDLRFVSSEYERNNIELWWKNSYYDTFRMAKSLNLGLENLKLTTLCAHFGIELTDAHTAMADVMATAKVFKKLVELANNEVPAGVTPLIAPTSSMPNDCSQWIPRSEVQATLDLPYDWFGFLDTLPNCESEIPDAVVQGYLTALHLSLINGSYSYRERERMEEEVASFSLSRGNVIDLNEEYLFLLICKNLHFNSGRWSATSTANMRTAVEFTGIRNSRVEELISETLEQKHLIPSGLQTLNDLFTLDAGDGVVITGEDFRQGRDYLTYKVEEAGLLLKSSTTKTGSKAVICNDPYGLSKNASLARQYGIPILTENTITALLG